jgi:hypothetical protein
MTFIGQFDYDVRALMRFCLLVILNDSPVRLVFWRFLFPACKKAKSVTHVSGTSVTYVSGRSQVSVGHVGRVSTSSGTGTSNPFRVTETAQ